MTVVVLPDTIAAVPLLGVVTDVTERVSSSASMSLATTLMSTAVFTAVATSSSTAVAAVLPGVTATMSLAGLAPTLFVARIQKLYSTSLVSPVTV